MSQTAINARCEEILSEIHSFNHTFITSDVILCVLLDRYNVSHLSQLGVQSIEEIPVLVAVNEMTRKIDAYVHVYLMNKYRPITTFRDLETEIVAMLNSFGIPPIRLGASKKDRNEIDIDDIDNIDDMEDVDVQLPSTFNEFGLGNLLFHPQIQLYFGVFEPNVMQHWPDTKEILSHLIDYAAKEPYFLGSPLQLDAFRSYLCQFYGIHQLQQVGVNIDGNLVDELLMVKHALHRRQLRIKEALAEEQRLEERLRKEHKLKLATITMQRALELDNDIKLASNRSQTMKIAMKQENIDTKIAAFFARVQSALADERSDSTYSPSLAQTNRAVISICFQGNDDMESEDCDSHHSKRARNAYGKTTGNRLSENTISQLQAVATEYAMLHIGGSKFLHRRLEVVPVDESAGPGNDDYLASSIEEGNDPLSKNPCVATDTTKKSAMPSCNYMAHRNDGAQLSEIAPVVSNCCNSASSTKRSVERFEAKKFVDTASGSGLISTQLLSQFLFLSDSAKSNQLLVISSEELRSVAAMMKSEFTTEDKSTMKSTLSSIGRWGEAFAYQLLLLSHPGAHIQWLNQAIETMTPYDFIVTLPGTHSDRKQIVYVEVKATRFADNNVMELSLQEWQFVSSLPRVRYCVFRVFGAAGDGNGLRVVVIPDLLDALQANSVKLCLAV